MKTKMLTIIALALVAHFHVAVRAATITVSNTGDSGAGTLRDALASAADGDTIDVTGVSGTILLTTGELLVTNSLTVVGPGPNNLAVDGNAASRVFFIGEGTTVTIASLTITNGFAPAAGSGIYNLHATLTVSNCTLSGNSARRGGGIFNDGSYGSATLTVSASTFSGNSASVGPGRGAGGGIYNYGAQGSATLMITYCTLSGNSAGFTNSVGTGSGGGIYNDGDGHGDGGSATLTVVNSTLSGNLGGGEGGGIYNAGALSGSATLTISNCTISGNSAGYGSGGGIFNDGYGDGGSATLTVVNSTLSGNLGGGEGGGILNDGVYGGSAALTVVNSTFSGNSASDGGGIFNLGFGDGGSATLTVVNSTFSGNSASDGGGIFNDGEFSGSATVEVGSTILNAGASGANITNVLGTVTSDGYNLSSDDGNGFLTATGDLINTDPMLGPLQDNGGPTFTHALLPGSPAIGAGDPNFTAPPDFDQRGEGFPRVVNGRIDIGAFEVQIVADSDGDGIPDSIDQCPDTHPGAIVAATGCSIAQLVPCDGPASGGMWKSHGQYVRAVIRSATDFLKAKLITRRQWVEIVTRAARSKCGWNRHCDHDGDRDWHRDWDCDRDRDWGRGRDWGRD